MSWKRDFPWLVHDEEKNTMKCKFAVLFLKLLTNLAPCSIGNGPFRRTTIQAHAKRKTHFKCFKQTLLGKKPGAAPMRTVLQNMNVQVQEKLQKLFNSATVLYDLSLGIYARPRVRRQKY